MEQAQWLRAHLVPLLLAAVLIAVSVLSHSEKLPAFMISTPTNSPATNDAGMQTPVALPAWLLNNPPVSASGELRRVSDLFAFEQLRPRTETDGTDLAQDNEAFDAVRRFFWARENGVVMEMGALDGYTYSVSKEFLPLAWHRILIEATPLWYEKAMLVSLDATYVAAAVCQRGTRVHYLSRPSTGSTINGIAEFMTENFVESWHPMIYDMATRRRSDGAAVAYNLTNVDWSSPQLDETATYAAAAAAASAVPDHTFARTIACVEINEVLDFVRVKHVNLFVLDVEGGELQVLTHIDFAAVRFDVLCVETDAGFRPAGYGAAVASLLATHGYEVAFESGRNTWFKNRLFVPSVRPA